MAEQQTTSDHEHNIHHVEPSWWPPILALSTGLVGVGIIFIGGGDIIIGVFFIALFFAIFALGLFAETTPKRFERAAKAKAARHEVVLEQGFAKHTFMWIFLASEVLFFTIVIGGSLSLRLRVGGWAPSEVLDVNLTAINTFILIASSYTMAKGLQAIERGNSRLAARFLFLTVAIGFLFLGIQITEYFELIQVINFEPGNVTGMVLHEGNLVEIENLQMFASTFFIQTGFHGLHVFFGVFIMFFVALKMYRGGYSKDNHDSVELMGLYWHFVDLVWIVLFTVVYLI